MVDNQSELKQKLKQRLFQCISQQIDLIDYVPKDITKLVGDFDFGSEMLGQASYDIETNPLSVDEATIIASSKEDLSIRINDYYDELFFCNDGLMGLLHSNTKYRNIGYREIASHSQHQASLRLQEILLDFIPVKTGRILDVACGLGESTHQLMKYYAPENIWAINISEKQLESARKMAKGCNFQVMNAVDLKFENAFFDNILCIEAAMHFETRQKFFEESYRVLNSGGRLVLSDILFSSKERLKQSPVYPHSDNHIESIEQYEKLLRDVGFKNITINNVSREVWGNHFLHAVNQVHERFYLGKISIIELTETLWTYYYVNSLMGLCLFICAEK